MIWYIIQISELYVPSGRNVPMIGVDSHPDSQDVSQFLTMLILTGDIEAAVCRFYQCLPQSAREARIREAISGMYSQLPPSIAVSIRDQQCSIHRHNCVQRQDSPVDSGREHTMFGGMKKISGILFLVWALLLGMIYALAPRSVLRLPTYSVSSRSASTVDGGHSLRRVFDILRVTR